MNIETKLILLNSPHTAYFQLSITKPLYRLEGI